MPASDPDHFTVALKPISEEIAQISRDIAGSFKELEQFSGYSEIGCIQLPAELSIEQAVRRGIEVTHHQYGPARRVHDLCQMR